MEYYNRIVNRVTNPSYTPHLAPLILLLDACDTTLIILKVPCKQAQLILVCHYLSSKYHPPLFSLRLNLNLANPVFDPDTEIDYSTYMQQVSLYLAGERDYTLLKGDTGPLVYPAGHVYVYSALHWLTNGGERIDVAQWVFWGVYLGVLAVVMAVYARAGVGSLMKFDERRKGRLRRALLRSKSSCGCRS